MESLEVYLPNVYLIILYFKSEFYQLQMILRII